MTTEAEIISRAREILTGKEAFADDASLFLDELSTVLAVAVDMSIYESHSDRNEYFSETAQLESSLLAKASDAGRIPDKPVPQIVTCEISCDETVEFNEDTEFLSGINSQYLINGTISVDSGTITTDLTQEKKVLYSYTPTGAGLQEFVVGNSKTSRFYVYVNSKLWEDFEKIGELKEDGEGYITRYNILGELYIRFGNGFLGKIPDGQINVVSYETESQDIQVGSPLQALGISEDVEIKVISIVQYSQPQESAESLSKSLPFWNLKAGGSGYDTDYIDDIKQGFPEVLTVRVWGEKKESSRYHRDNINVIFVSALRAGNQEKLGYEIIELLKSAKNVLQIQFEWKEPTLISSSISITGTTERTKNITTSEAVLREAIGLYYSLYAGKDVRKNKIYKSNITSIIKATGVFDNLLPNKSRNDEPEYDFEISGSQIPSSGREIIYIPDENITIDISHVDNT